MSMSYWMIEGIGLHVRDIMPYVNKEKAARFFYEQFPDDYDLADMVALNDYSSFDMEAFYHDNGFENLADVLCHCDDTSSTVFGDDGDGNVYFYYPPSMPWRRRDSEPQSEQEAVDRIIKAVQKITNMSREEIQAVIDTDLYVAGMG